jgi:hypothetical protein
MIILRITTVASNQEKQFSQMERIQKLVKRRITILTSSKRLRIYSTTKKLDQTMLDFVDKLKNNLEKPKI